MSYQPYTGPAGPTQEQVDGNNVALLTEINTRFPALRTRVQDLSERVPVDEGYTEIVITKENGEMIYTGYDRWGFMIEGNSDYSVDQGSMEEALEAIQNWSSK